jgi:hypothetical protein
LNCSIRWSKDLLSSSSRALTASAVPCACLEWYKNHRRELSAKKAPTPNNTSPTCCIGDLYGRPLGAVLSGRRIHQQSLIWIQRTDDVVSYYLYISLQQSTFEHNTVLSAWLVE